MKIMPLLITAVLCLLLSSVAVAQPAHSRFRLLWKIAVKNKTELPVDSTNWRQVKFTSYNANINYRFIKETGYFEIRLVSIGKADLLIECMGKKMYFPEIRYSEMVHYKKVILGVEERYDPELLTSQSSKAFFDDPDEHMIFQIHNTPDQISICPKNIIVKGDRNNPKSIPLNNKGIVSIIRNNTGKGYFFCSEEITAMVDTVAIPTDLQPRSSIRLNLTTNSTSKTVCPEAKTKIDRDRIDLPVYISTLSNTYQVMVNGKYVNSGLYIPHHFIYTKTDLPEEWINVIKEDPDNGTPDTKTIYADPDYRVTISPKKPTVNDSILITAINLASNFRKEKGYVEYRINRDTKTLNRKNDLQLAISHSCGSETETKEITYQVKIPPVKRPGYYHINFKPHFLFPNKKYTSQKHCFEAIPASVWIEIK